MITKFAQSWRLFKASIGITFRHRKLLWFPVLSTLLTGLMALFFLAPLVLPVVLHPTGYRVTQKEHWKALRDYYMPVDDSKTGSAPAVSHAGLLQQIMSGLAAADGSGHRQPAGGDKQEPRKLAHVSPLVSLYLVVIYFVSMFLATFFNTAFYSEIIAALNGRGVSFRRGLRLAWSRLPSILAWSLLAGAVGWLIHKLQERLPFVGRIITGFLGLAWSVAAVFAIPVIVQEQPVRNPIKILKQSALTLQRTWGEGLIGYLGFSAGSWMIVLFSLALLAVGIGMGIVLKSFFVGLIAVVVWVTGLLCLSYISSVSGHVYRCALYIYAAEGVVPEPYDKDLLDMAWKVKKN